MIVNWQTRDALIIFPSGMYSPISVMTFFLVPTLQRHCH